MLIPMIRARFRVFTTLQKQVSYRRRVQDRDSDWREIRPELRIGFDFDPGITT